MKIKTKITLGVGALLGLILLLSMVGMAYINALKSDTERILADNYNSVEYAHSMLAAIDSTDPEATRQFEMHLRKQQQTITEVGESEITRQLRADFSAFKTGSEQKRVAVKQSLFQLMDLNMQAIQRKSNLAAHTAEIATFWLSVTGILCFLIAFILLVNLPANIANPVRDLTSSIRQIASGKYSERVDLTGNHEFRDLAGSFNTMAEKLEEYNNSNLAQIMMEKKRIETLINNMHDPVIGLDEHLKVIFANAEAVKIIGLDTQELIGRDSRDIAVRNDLVRLLIGNLVHPDKTEAEKKPEPLKIYADGRESYFEKETLDIAILPTGEKEQLVIGHVLILRNVTAYKELDFAKTNFIATVSHEFKTPIAAIKMSLQLLENKRVGPLNEEQTNLLHSITDDADRLLKITGELLNLTQVESGNIQLSMLPADPEAMLREAVSANKTQAEQKNIRLEIDLPENLPQVLADSDKTGWVLTNLISNAIRYSHEDSVILLSVRSEMEKLQFVVTDTGPGIPPQYLAKVFDRYFRVPGTNQPGTGLGLSISKEFIEAQGGTISVESEPGVGSTFKIMLNRVE
jgi:NtrC-family two-component system sensor histidine kinase KinB